MALKREEIVIPLEGGGGVSGLLDIPEGFATDRTMGVIVAHGAGNDMSAPLLEAFCSGLARAGCLALRFNFPYKDRGKRAPDPPHRLEAAWKAAYGFTNDQHVRNTIALIFGKPTVPNDRAERKRMDAALKIYRQHRDNGLDSDEALQALADEMEIADNAEVQDG